jgi:hypothetical protein
VTGKADHVATSGSHSILACWPVQEQDWASGQLVRQVQAVASSLQAKKQKDPHSKGFQCTPAFVYEVVQQLLVGADEGNMSVQPRGGFTDVGQHTGSQARATAWPLVEQLVLVSHRPCIPSICIIMGATVR